MCVCLMYCIHSLQVSHFSKYKLEDDDDSDDDGTGKEGGGVKKIKTQVIWSLAIILTLIDKNN